MKQKTSMQELIDICNKDQVSFTEWFLDNYETYLEKEKEQIVEAANNGCGSRMCYIDSERDGVNYYNVTYKQD